MRTPRLSRSAVQRRFYAGALEGSCCDSGWRGRLAHQQQRRRPERARVLRAGPEVVLRLTGGLVNLSVKAGRPHQRSLRICVRSWTYAVGHCRARSRGRQVLFSVSQTHAVASNPPGRAYLVIDRWDDWFRFETLFQLVWVDGDGIHRVGDVKIGEVGQVGGQPGEAGRRPALPPEFDALGPQFFSVGQDDSYYENLSKLGPSVRDRILVCLRDIARNPEILAAVESEKVLDDSLLRSVSLATVRGQFRRMAEGGVRLTPYSFVIKRVGQETDLAFDVTPDSRPPTNIHVIIGRNGVGKTRLLRGMSEALLGTSDAPRVAFEALGVNLPVDLFANVVTVTFSAFDPFGPLEPPEGGVGYTYVGLKAPASQQTDAASTNPTDPKVPRVRHKDLDELTAEFVDAANVCRLGARNERWRKVLQLLESDPIFGSAAVAALASSEESVDTERLFGLLSAGHKLVLLTVSRLVELVEEKTLVLMDEPEAHLHPPLLSAFVRSLSELLINRNGVAIVATHSPVVLQEVPSSCVWKLRRVGSSVEAERPEIQTFGENVGVLTREVFGLEVSGSGFHRLLAEQVDKGLAFEEIDDLFGSALGGEARAIVRGLVAAREARE